jgi:hypothetical protein
MNYLKYWAGPISVPSFSSGSLDANGFPNGTLSANLGGIINIPVSKSTTTKVLKWTGVLGGFNLFFGTLVTVGGGFVISGGAGGNTQTIVGGTNGRVVFTITQSPYSESLNTFFTSGSTFSGLTSMVLCDLADEADVDAGEIFNTDFVNTVNDLNPATLRTMSWSNNSGSDAFMNPKFSYRSPVTALSWQQTRYISTAAVGTISNTGSAYSCSSYTDMPATWTHGEVFQGTVTNANTVLTVTGAANNGSGLIRLTLADTSSLSTNQIVSFLGYNPNSVAGDAMGAWKITVIDGTHIDLAESYPSGVPSVYSVAFSTNGFLSTATIDVGGRGPKLLSGGGAIPFRAGSMASGQATFTYNSTLDQVLYKSGGLTCLVPLEVHIALCNKTHKNLWLNISSMTDDASVTAMAQMVSKTLRSGLSFYPEVSNETWNPNFVQFFYFWQMGVANGLSGASSGNVQQSYSAAGMRTREVMGLITTAWLAQGRPQADLKRVMPCQAFGSTTLFDTYKFKGNDLAAFGYNTFPNRPIDYCDVISYAPYSQGALLNVEYPANASGATVYADMTTAADDYDSGDTARMASALAWVDSDFRTATSFPAGVVNGNLYKYGRTTGAGGNNIYYGWEAVRAGYDGARPSGIANLTCEPYEGSVQFLGPTSAQCTGLNISTAYAAKVTALLDAYLASPYASALAISYCKQFIGTEAGDPTFGLFPQNKNMAWLCLTGPNQWALMPGSIYSTPYQTYSGFRTFNNT